MFNGFTVIVSYISTSLWTAWLLMIAAGIVHEAVSIEPFSYLTSLVITVFGLLIASSYYQCMRNFRAYNEILAMRKK